MGAVSIVCHEHFLYLTLYRCLCWWNFIIIQILLILMILRCRSIHKSSSFTNLTLNWRISWLRITEIWIKFVFELVRFLPPFLHAVIESLSVCTYHIFIFYVVLFQIIAVSFNQFDWNLIIFVQRKSIETFNLFHQIRIEATFDIIY